MDLSEHIAPNATTAANSQLALLAELENSLLASQAALLSHKIALLEQFTRHQMTLRDKLCSLLSTASSNNAGTHESNRKMLAAVLFAQKRVLHEARVQQVLLQRAQQFLKTFFHAASARTATYSPHRHTNGVEVSIHSVEEE